MKKLIITLTNGRTAEFVNFDADIRAEPTPAVLMVRTERGDELGGFVLSAVESWRIEPFDLGELSEPDTAPHPSGYDGDSYRAGWHAAIRNALHAFEPVRYVQGGDVRTLPVRVEDVRRLIEGLEE